MIKKQQGVSMLELLLGLAIIAIIIIMSIRFFQVTMASHRAVNTAQQVNKLVKASYEWLNAQKQADFTGITEQKLIDAGLADTRDFTSVWDTAINITTLGDPTHVAVIVKQIPRSTDCSLVADKLALASFLDRSSACIGGEGAVDYRGTF